MKLVYVAGPYRAPTGWGIEGNIQRARELGAMVAQAGAYPVIPHSNTSHMDGLAPDALWLDGTLELMRRCDAVIFTLDWERSTGARAERAEAERLGLSCFENIFELRGWLARVGHG
jgi:nucleoside 2-deoxyribosyltransferase